MAIAEQHRGLAGICAGETAISTVGKSGVGLCYRGYAIEDLSAHASFEEVSYLLLYGDLPSAHQLLLYQGRLQQKRSLPEAMKGVLQQIPAQAHPMDVLRTGCSMLGCLEPEAAGVDIRKIGERLLGLFPAMLLYWHHYHTCGICIETQSDEASIAGHFLHLLHQKPPKASHRQALDQSLTLYAEHEFNASTFAARVAASTRSDVYSAITAAIGTLRGPLHGGANEATMALVQRFHTPQEAEQGILAALQQKILIMGFGHRVYTSSDPRSALIKKWALQLGGEIQDERYIAVSERIEQVLWREKKLFPNLDFYAATVYFFMRIPVPLYTPIFVCARVAGWLAHIVEQRDHNRLIRPNADYVGPEPRAFVPLAEREQG